MGHDDAPQRDLASEYYTEVGAGLRTAPGIAAGEAQYQPQFDAVSLDSISNLLYGTPAGETNQLYNQGGKIKLRPVATPGSMGLLAMQAKTRSANIANLSSSDPATASLIQRMTDQSQAGVDAGTRLDPAQMRNVQQSIRSRQAGTVLQNGNAGAYDEALGVSQYGDQLYQQRMATAASTLGLRNAQFGQDPTAMAYGISSNNNLGRLLMPSTNANDLYSSNQNATATSDAANQNANAALYAAAIGSAGKIAGAAAGA